MMSGAQYHITYSHILESQRCLNLLNILSPYNKPKASLPLNNLSKPFLQLQMRSLIYSCDPYIEAIHDLNSINLDIHILQSIVFIGGYAVYSYLKTTSCHYCIQLLIENKDIEITDARKYDFVSNIDRGSLYCGKYSLKLMKIKF